jgi:protein MpaA
MNIVTESNSRTAQVPSPARRSVARLLEPLHDLSENSKHILSKSFGFFESHGQQYTLPRYVFLGPKGGGDTIRIGIFAAIHGDEPEGALGLIRFLQDLTRDPDLAQGYALFIYPVCNPTGFEDGTRHSRSGKDLNREFWKDSVEPEVRFLETEIWTHAFHGIINLHCDDTSHGLYGFVNGEVLSKNLLEPALHSAEAFLPRNRKRKIDGFKADAGIVYECYEGVLKAVPGLNPSPFEITLETPHKAPRHPQVEAFSKMLQTILLEYRYMMAVGANI